MSKGFKVFAVRETSLVIDVTRVTMDLELTKESHATCVTRSDAELLCFRDKLRSVKAEQFAISKNLDKTRNEKALLLNKLESIETKFALVESELSDEKANQAKLLKMAM